MKRTVEPELMDDEVQALAYADVDFSDVHSQIMDQMDVCWPGLILDGAILDLGCGPGDIAFRCAKKFPGCRVVGIDGSAPMIKLADQLKAQESEISSRVEFVQAMMPGSAIPKVQCEAIVSNSLLHHLHDPSVMWRTILEYAKPGTKIFIADLMRPNDDATVNQLVQEYAGNESAIHKADFYNSLHAAFEVNEVQEQLEQAGLNLSLIHI